MSYRPETLGAWLIHEAAQTPTWHVFDHAVTTREGDAVYHALMYRCTVSGVVRQWGIDRETLN